MSENHKRRRKNVRLVGTEPSIKLYMSNDSLLNKEQSAYLEMVQTVIFCVRSELYPVDENIKVGILADLLDAIHFR